MTVSLVEYQRRHQKAEAARVSLDKRFRLLGNIRLLLALTASILLWLASWQAFSVWLVLLPVLAFVAVAIWHKVVRRRRNAASRAIAYYAEALQRVQDNWTGRGATGDSFRRPDHVFADDLDVFGKGSLFQLISRARTSTGEQTLAQWILEPADRDVVLARQEAVRELSAALDLREDIALLGETVGPAIHATPLAEWGSAPAVPLPKALRPLAFCLALLGLVTLVAFLRGPLPLFPFLVVFLFDVLVIFVLRHSVARIASSLETPAHDLSILALLIQRLEREQFHSPYLQSLRAALNIAGIPASRRIACLRRWVELLDSSDHVIVRVIGPLLLWKQQIAAGVELWRRTNGPHILRWLGAVSEFEALSSLACLAYERPDWTFPHLLDQPNPSFAAKDIRHPLLPAARCVPNDVSLGEGTDLLIVSGSNMSGKSTLLRSIGLNALLAWAGAPVCAGDLSVSSICVGASIRVTDSLQDNRSRFFAEITRLRQIVDLSKGARPLLFLLDELLSGTNSHDRKIGAAAVVRSLVNARAFGLITTHDLALASIEQDLAGRARNVHFQDEMVDGRIEFDYRLRPGIVTRSNALALMRAVGLEV
jgi:hypothetical protein